MRKAFTLIELLVVIAIIAILAAILFPVFAQAKQSAKQTASLNSQKQIITSQIMYDTDNDDVAVPFVWYNRGDGVYLTWMEMINPYIKSKDLFINPGASQSQSAYGVNCGTAATTNPKVTSNYCMPMWIPYEYWNWFGTIMFAGFPVEENAISGCTAAGVAPYGGACLGATHVDEPANVSVVVPGYMVTYNRAAPALESNTQFGSACTTGFAPQHTVGGYPIDTSIQVFRAGGNYAMADGHAKYFSTMNMNGNASRVHTIGTTNYPSSPYMVVKQ